MRHRQLSRGTATDADEAAPARSLPRARTNNRGCERWAESDSVARSLTGGRAPCLAVAGCAFVRGPALLRVVTRSPQPAAGGREE
eukprot:364457-Chlamydomonas_euryale.AAC.5